MPNASAAPVRRPPSRIRSHVGGAGSARHDVPRHPRRHRAQRDDQDGDGYPRQKCRDTREPGGHHREPQGLRRGHHGADDDQPIDSATDRLLYAVQMRDAHRPGLEIADPARTPRYEAPCQTSQQRRRHEAHQQDERGDDGAPTQATRRRDAIGQWLCHVEPDSCVHAARLTHRIWARCEILLDAAELVGHGR